MVWQDLVASREDFAKKLIGEAIKGLAHVDPNPGVVLFTPEAARLSPRQRVLVFLVALQATRACRACWWHIKKRTCIGVKELDLALMELQQAHLIDRWIGRYSVREPALPFVKAEIDATKKFLGIK